VTEREDKGLFLGPADLLVRRFGHRVTEREHGERIRAPGHGSFVVSVTG
jgi:hypothetical protein